MKMTEREKARREAERRLKRKLPQWTRNAIAPEIIDFVGDLILKYRQERNRERMLNYRNQDFYEQKIDALQKELKDLAVW
jgi:hypothetical protein